MLCCPKLHLSLPAPFPCNRIDPETFLGGDSFTPRQRRDLAEPAVFPPVVVFVPSARPPGARKTVLFPTL